MPSTDTRCFHGCNHTASVSEEESVNSAIIEIVPWGLKDCSYCLATIHTCLTDCVEDIKRLNTRIS